MNYHEQFWSNLVEYASNFAPIIPFHKGLIAYLGDGNKTAFRQRELAWYNPISNRFRFNCGYRFAIGVYQNCDHGCLYCYVNSYSKEIKRGRKKSSFISHLERDIKDFRAAELPQAPVHISNSCDPLQERLEKKHRDTLNTLILLSQNQGLFTNVILLTKNPSLLFDKNADYLSVIKNLNEKFIIEITIPFFRDNYKLYEPFAPHPLQRLEALQSLINDDVKVRLRLDPIFPCESGIQSNEDIVNILDRCAGVDFVISKPLRLVKPKDGQATAFYDEMSKFYSGGKKTGIEWHGGRYVFAGDRAKQEMAFLNEQCEKRNIKLVHCKNTVLVDDTGMSVLKKQADNMKRK
jgi:DNA repair photolyase